MLNLIISKCPAHAATAAKILRRPSDKLMLKGTSNLATEALSDPVFTSAERAALGRIAADIDDDSRYKTFRVRLSPEEWTAMQAAADEAGFKDLSGYARWKLFGVRD